MNIPIQAKVSKGASLIVIYNPNSTELRRIEDAVKKAVESL